MKYPANGYLIRTKADREAKMSQLLCHIIGDYALQSTWMANNKTKRWFPALVHVSAYFIPFLIVFKPSLAAAAVIIGTHAVIDRYRLVKYVVFAGQHLAPPKEWKPWAECNMTGYHKDIPVWLATWLIIIIDNAIHLTINAWALASL